MQRRQLFKRIGAALVVAPFLSFAPTAHATETPVASIPGVIAGNMGQSTVWKQTPVFPTFSYSPRYRPSMFDPLGQWGVVFVKYTVEGKTYTQYVQFTDISSNATDEQIFDEGKRLLLEEMKKKLFLINPQAYFVLGDNV